MEALRPAINPYEQFLVDVADVCEGSEAKNKEVGEVADIIKLAIARDPGDISFMTYLVKAMLEGKNLAADEEVVGRAKIAKFLLQRLLKLMSERSLEVRNTKIVALNLPESRVYAGLLGIATTEFARMTRKDVILVRREEGKVVVTVRTINDRAYRICEELASRTGGRFGGHAEAASATLPDMELSEAVKIVSEVVSVVSREDRERRMRKH
jgi:nanoRNase/pAp phosphatase (c-di-AMP/oligoRNAs hydrolase)